MKGSVVAAVAALSGAVSAGSVNRQHAALHKRNPDEAEKCECTTRYETITGEPTCKLNQARATLNITDPQRRDSQRYQGSQGLGRRPDAVLEHLPDPGHVQLPGKDGRC